MPNAHPIMDQTPRWMRVRYRTPNKGTATFSGRIWIEPTGRIFGSDVSDDPKVEGGIIRHMLVAHKDDIVAVYGEDPLYQEWVRLPWNKDDPSKTFTWEEVRRDHAV